MNYKNEPQQDVGQQYDIQEYVPKGKTTKITISSRVSKKLGNDFVTVEYSEERTIPEDAVIELERKALWDEANAEVDNQIDEIYNLYKKEGLLNV